MKKRLLSLVLVLAMAVSMISCGSSNKAAKVDVAALFDKMDGFQTKTSEGTVAIKASGKEIKQLGVDTLNVSLKVSSVVENEKKSQAKISYKLEEGSEYKDLTTIIVDNTVVYVDLGTLKTAVMDVCTTYNQQQVGAMVSVLPAANYVKVDMQQIAALSKTDLNALMSSQDTVTVQKMVLAVVEHVVKTLDDTTKEVSPAVITGNDSELKVSINKDNIQKVSEEILKLDLDKEYDEAVQKVKEVGNTDQYVTEMQKAKADVVAGIKKVAEEIKTSKDKIDAFSYDIDIKTSGDKGSRKLSETVSVKAEQEGTKVDVSADVTANEKAGADEKITIPADAVDFMSYAMQLQGLLGK